MKKLLISAISLASIAAIAESLYIPVSSDSHTDNYVLKEGEIVYKNVDDMYATMMIGNDTRRPFYVSDERALKCENIYQTIDETALVIEKSDNVTYENGTYLIVNTKGATDPDNNEIATFIITAPVGYILGSATYDLDWIDNAGRLGFAQPDVTMKFDANVAILTATVKYASEVKFWNFAVKVKNTNSNIINNTTEEGKDFVIADDGYTTQGHGSAATGSTFKLSKLRNWVANLYNGDRGRHWANYPATNDVFMANHVLKWRNATGPIIGFRDDGDKLSWYYEGKRSMFLTQSVQEAPVALDYSESDISITEIDVNTYASSNICRIVFTYADIPECALSKFQVKYTPTLESPDWIYLNPKTIEIIDTTATNSTIAVTVTKKPVTATKDQGFWAISYDTTLTSVVTPGGGIATVKVIPQIVVDKSDFIVTSKLVLKSPGGKYFTLNVSDTGALTTSEYTDTVNTTED